MLFNTYQFIFAFLPLAIAGFFVFGVFSRTWALRWIIITSLFFYAAWRPLNVLLIAPSIVINFALAQVLVRLSDGENRSFSRTSILWLGIAFNIAFLGYFKYSDFIRSTVNDVFGANLVLTHVILPLGISFITFQKIAFLIDVHAGRVKSFGFQDYCLFVLFFPQLIAGPIVHYREMVPQFHTAPGHFDKENLAVGFTLFFFGLFKKVIFADSIAPLIAPIYEQAAGGGNISFLYAWLAAIGFTLQIYFDFSGYSDMALGLARFFGIRLPQNFDSPLKASSIIDFWARWHMTLTRFLTAYIYNPLVLRLTRRRAEKARFGTVETNALMGFAYLVMFPTLLTFFLAGVWHGAGYGFIVFGLLHGIYLTVNRCWRLIAQKLWSDRAKYNQIMKPVGVVLVIIAAAVANVFFRSPTIGGAVALIKGMVGLSGIELPQILFDNLRQLASGAQSIGAAAIPESSRNLVKMMIWIPSLLFLALFFPNTIQILARYEPALGVKPPLKRTHIEWSTSLFWAITVSGVAAISVIYVGGRHEFLYWQF